MADYDNPWKEGRKCEGDTVEDQVHSLARFLDWLTFQEIGPGRLRGFEAVERGEAVVIPDLFLDQRTLPAGFDHLQQALARVGSTVMNLLGEVNGVGQVQLLGGLLAFLADRGWRPNGMYALWQELIDRAGKDAAARRHLLRLALRHAVRHEHVQNLQARLDELDNA